MKKSPILILDELGLLCYRNICIPMEEKCKYLRFVHVLQLSGYMLYLMHALQ